MRCSQPTLVKAEQARAQNVASFLEDLGIDSPEPQTKTLPSMTAVAASVLSRPTMQRGPESRRENTDSLSSRSANQRSEASTKALHTTLSPVAEQSLTRSSRHHPADAGVPSPFLAASASSKPRGEAATVPTRSAISSILDMANSPPSSAVLTSQSQPTQSMSSAAAKVAAAKERVMAAAAAKKAAKSAAEESSSVLSKSTVTSNLSVKALKTKHATDKENARPRVRLGELNSGVRNVF